MRYILLPMALAFLASVSPNPAHAAGKTQASAAPPAQSGENCGTPDEFKACPPLPRHPLQNYPANKKS